MGWISMAFKVSKPDFSENYIKQKLLNLFDKNSKTFFFLISCWSTCSQATFWTNWKRCSGLFAQELKLILLWLHPWWYWVDVIVSSKKELIEMPGEKPFESFILLTNYFETESLVKFRHCWYLTLKSPSISGRHIFQL